MRYERRESHPPIDLWSRCDRQYLCGLFVPERLSKDFHVIVVAYDGFNPSEPDTEFVSVMDEARQLGDYILEHHD